MKRKYIFSLVLISLLSSILKYNINDMILKSYNYEVSLFFDNFLKLNILILVVNKFLICIFMFRKKSRKYLVTLFILSSSMIIIFQYFIQNHSILNSIYDLLFLGAEIFILKRAIKKDNNFFAIVAVVFSIIHNVAFGFFQVNIQSIRIVSFLASPLYILMIYGLYKEEIGNVFSYGANLLFLLFQVIFIVYHLVYSIKEASYFSYLLLSNSIICLFFPLYYHFSLKSYEKLPFSIINTK